MPSTLRPTVPTAIVDSMITATIGAWTTINKTAIDYWFGAINRQTTPFDMVRELATWTHAVADRQEPPWAHEHTIVKEWPLARLRDYSTPDADPSMVATVILPPQAGHSSSIVDFAEDQSQVIVARDSGCHRIYSLDWIGATQETKDASIDDYMSLLRETAALLGRKINLVGDCQGGWLATIFAAHHPELVNSLAIAGAPIDFHAGEPLIHEWVSVIAPDNDLSVFRGAVAANDGLLPGRFLLDGFKAMQPDHEFARSMQLLTNMHDSPHVERYRKFENWFQWTQPLPGEFFLWVAEYLFMRNSLIKGELVVEGRKVDLAAIDCPLFLMAGRTDHITPDLQVWALADYASTPPERIGRQSADSGHLGLFMSHEALTTHWPVIFEEMAALSTPTPDDDPNVLTDEPTRSKPTRWGAAPAAKAEAPKPAKARAPKVANTETPKADTKLAEAVKAPASKTATTKAPTAKASKSPAAKSAAPKAPAAKVNAPASAAAAAKVEATKEPTAKPATRKASAPKANAPKAAVEKVEARKASTAKVEAPKIEAPKATAPNVEEPKAPAAKTAARKAPAAKAAAPKVDTAKSPARKAEAPKPPAANAEAPTAKAVAPKTAAPKAGVTTTPKTDAAAPAASALKASAPAVSAQPASATASAKPASEPTKAASAPTAPATEPAKPEPARLFDVDPATPPAASADEGATKK